MVPAPFFRCCYGGVKQEKQRMLLTILSYKD